LVIAPAASAVSAPTATENDLQWLHVDGSSIAREDDAIVILRGVNVPQLGRSGPALSRYSAYLDEARSMGFNVIRLPVSWAELEPSSGRFSAAYLDAIKNIVDLAAENGMYVVVDMHQLKMDGFPTWVVPRLKTSDRAAAVFWRNSALQQELVKTWETLASLLKDRSAVAGYDLLNEPYGGTIMWQDFAPILNELYSKLISGIRSVDDRHIIFFEPTEGVCILGEHIALRPKGMNLAFSPHFYVSGSAEYLNNVAQQLYNLTVSTWKIPLWIGEFGGLSIDLADIETLHSLAVTLELFDRYALGWAYWSLAETDADPHLIDGHGQGSPFLTSTMTRIFPSSFAADNVTFTYNNTPRFQLRASTNSPGTIEVSVPAVFQSTVPRCIDCVSTWNNDQHSLTIEIRSNKTAYFYLDAPVTISQLEKLAESEFEQALQISDELKTTAFHSPLSREHVREIDDIVASMQSNLTAKHYELVLHKLDRVEQLRTLALQEEDKYTRAETFVNSVRQEILSSQGYLSKWQLVLLSQAYESLDQGNYTAAIEWAKQANDLPREPTRQESDPTLTGVLWTCSLALLGVVAVFIALRAFRRREPSTGKMRPAFLKNPEDLPSGNASVSVAILHRQRCERSSPSLGVFAPHICPKIRLSADKDLRSKKKSAMSRLSASIV
jgi:endoglycosylceramidase